MKRKSLFVVLILLVMIGVWGFISLKSTPLTEHQQTTSAVINDELAYKENDQLVYKETEVFLTSPYKQPALYEEAFASASASATGKQTVLAGITSHHFLAKNLIANFFQGIDNSNIRQIILIGPDHFNYTIHDQFLAHSSLLNWQTPFSILNSGQNLINQLHQQALITIKDTAFRNEHSIYTLIPFIKYYFPEADVVPLILNPKKANSEFFDFGQTIKKDLDSSSTLLIVSSDFSHQLSLEKSQQTDLESINTLNELNLANLETVNCDCQPCLAFLLGYLADESYQFALIDNKSSAEFSDETQETVTSYVSAYFVKK
ncbi:MAG TPA: AmmeMemoRadiSam system protein B [Candidatus Woesebacteria bacterium]|nr:AmmeMemoRadiSam system protein B [Candidatus Woesebacteria bacterium]